MHEDMFFLESLLVYRSGGEDVDDDLCEAFRQRIPGDIDYDERCRSVHLHPWIVYR